MITVPFRPSLPTLATIVAGIAVSMVMGCSKHDGVTRPAEPDTDILLKDGSPGLAEVFAETDSSGHTYYWLAYPPSGRLLPFEERGRKFRSIPDLVKEISAATDTNVIASDPKHRNSMWIVGDRRVRPLNGEELANIRSLLGD